MNRDYDAITDRASTDWRAAACPPIRSCASRVVGPAVTVGGAMPTGTNQSRRWDGRPRRRSSPSGSVVRQALPRDRIPRTVPGEPSGERPVLLRHPHGRVDVEPRVRPGEHAGGLLLIKQPSIHPPSATPVTVLLRDSPFRRNVRDAPAQRCLLQTLWL